MPTIIVQYYMLCILINHKSMRNQHREIQAQVDNIQGNAGASWKQTGKFKRRPTTYREMQAQAGNRQENSGAGRKQTRKFSRRSATDGEIQVQAGSRQGNSGAGRQQTGKFKRRPTTDWKIQVRVGNGQGNVGASWKRTGKFRCRPEADEKIQAQLRVKDKATMMWSFKRSGIRFTVHQRTPPLIDYHLTRWRNSRRSIRWTRQWIIRAQYKR